MNNNTRKIVVLNNLKSQRIEQAIFILRDESNSSEADAVSEAERIVDAYLSDMQKPLFDKNTLKKKKNKHIILISSAALIVSFLLFITIGIIN